MRAVYGKVSAGGRRKEGADNGIIRNLWGERWLTPRNPSPSRRKAKENSLKVRRTKKARTKNVSRVLEGNTLHCGTLSGLA